MRRVTEHATEILPPGAYCTPEWYEARRKAVSASEISAILGLANDRWSSPFDLYWAKKSGVDSQSDNADMRRGKRYEPLILEEFNERHPEFALVPVGLTCNDDRSWQVCTPDALAYEEPPIEPTVPFVTDAGTLNGPTISLPVAVVEAKSGARRDEWGEEGTDDIPVGYRCQVLWQMDTLGLAVAYVPVLFGFDFRVYVVEWDEADVTIMREAAERFLDDLVHDREPDIDAARATTRRLKLLHPLLIDGVEIVPEAAWRQYHMAKRLRDCAEARMRLAENRIRHSQGAYKHGVILDGETQRIVSSRSVKDMPARTQNVRAHTRDSLYIKPLEDKA